MAITCSTSDRASPPGISRLIAQDGETRRNRVMVRAAGIEDHGLPEFHATAEYMVDPDDGGDRYRTARPSRSAPAGLGMAGVAKSGLGIPFIN